MVVDFLIDNTSSYLIYVFASSVTGRYFRRDGNYEEKIYNSDILIIRRL